MVTKRQSRLAQTVDPVTVGFHGARRGTIAPKIAAPNRNLISVM
jgi:hypothetical protein